jgi:hypothetical protein
MGQALAAWLHAAAVVALARVQDRRGQGTVEYLGVVVMVTLLIAALAIAAKGWAPGLGASIKKALEGIIKYVTKGL